MALLKNQFLKNSKVKITLLYQNEIIIFLSSYFLENKGKTVSRTSKVTK
jgi:hypothetical protein